MDLKQLRYFIGICDAGSISRAAKILRIAQPALSNHVSNMEASLGVELLHRSSQGVIPTESGEILYSAAQRIMRDVSRISEEVRTLQKEPVGRVAIGVAETHSNILGHLFLERMIKGFPRIALHYSSGQSLDLYRKLKLGMLDIGLFYKEPEIVGVHSKVLLSEDLFVVSTYREIDSKPIGNPVTLEELRTLPFVFPRKTHFSIRSIVENTFLGVDLAPQVVAEVDSFTAMKKYIAKGLACTILPWASVQDEVENKTIMIRPIEGVKMARNIELNLPLDRPASVAIEVTSRLLIEVIQELITSGSWRYASLVEDLA